MHTETKLTMICGEVLLFKRCLMNVCGDARKNGNNASEPGSNVGSRKKLFCGNDNCNGYHHNWIHNSENELNCHWCSAAQTTRCTLFATKPKTCFILGA